MCVYVRDSTEKEEKEKEMADDDGAAKTKKRVVELHARSVTASSFSRFGQLITPAEDGAPYDAAKDAQLDLARGRPRFYIMRLRERATSAGCMVFDNITHHANVTQCLGGLGQHSWYMAVAEAGRYGCISFTKRELMVSAWC